MATFFTADAHFGDPGILRRRGGQFISLDAHDESLIARWNEVVSPADEVWHLGDFAAGASPARCVEVFDRLNGVNGSSEATMTPIGCSAWLGPTRRSKVPVSAFRTTKGPRGGCSSPITPIEHGRGRGAAHAISTDILMERCLTPSGPVTLGWTLGVTVWSALPTSLPGRTRQWSCRRNLPATQHDGVPTTEPTHVPHPGL